MSGARAFDVAQEEQVRQKLRELAENCRAEEATLWLLDASGERLNATLNHGPKRDILETMSVPIAGSVVGLVVSTGIATCIGPSDRHNTSVDEATGNVTRAMAAAPVVIAGQVVGALSTINPRARLLFDSADLAGIESAAHELSEMLDER